MTTKTILATLAGAAFNFLAGWVVFGILLMDFYMSNTTSYEGLMKGEMPDLVMIFIAGIFSAYLIVYLLKRVGKENTFATGFKHGLVVYFCIAAATDLSMYAFYNLMNMTATITDILVQAVFGGVNGGIIALVLGNLKKE